MQYFFRLFFVFFMVIVTSPVLASGNVRIGEAVINFQSGSIDPETLNGEISGITINMADGRTSYADRLTIYSTSDGDTLTLDQLTIINMIMEDYDGSLAMSQLDWRGLVITGALRKRCPLPATHAMRRPALRIATGNGFVRHVRISATLTAELLTQRNHPHHPSDSQRQTRTNHR